MFKKSIILFIIIFLCGFITVNAQTNSEGTIVPGGTLAEKISWLQRSADSHNTYILIVTENENISPVIFEYRGAVNITIILRGDDTNRIIRLRSNDTMFTVRSNVTLILDNNITLQGHRRERGSMVYVDGGMLIMNEGSAIIGNTVTGSSVSGAGVWVGNRGTFTMNGGIISGNSATGGGGGVYVDATFNMNGGTISENSGANGGGVHVAGSGTFTMTNGVISGNTAVNGGGVFKSNWGTFTMRGGSIIANTASGHGGGVRADSSRFTKTGGIITGYNSDQENGNVVRDDDGVLARRGHAVFVSENQRKEINVGQEDRLNSGSSGSSGGWDN